MGYYYFISNRGKGPGGAEDVEITAVQNVLLRNLERDYPPTPKEVVRYFAEITKCFYNEKYTEKQM